MSTLSVVPAEEVLLFVPEYCSAFLLAARLSFAFMSPGAVVAAYSPQTTVLFDVLLSGGSVVTKRGCMGRCEVNRI